MLGLSRCISQGETKKECINNIKKSIELYVSTLKEDGIAVPEENFEAMLMAV